MQKNSVNLLPGDKMDFIDNYFTIISDIVGDNLALLELYISLHNSKTPQDKLSHMIDKFANDFDKSLSNYRDELKGQLAL